MPFVPNSRMPGGRRAAEHNTATSVDVDVDEVPDVNELRATDRCVRCDAQAYVRTVTAGSQVLDWCAHHYREHEDALSARGAKVVTDQRGRLTEQVV